MAGQEHDQRHILRHPVPGGCRLGCQAGCGILPALLVLWVRIGINESPPYERVTAQMVRQELKKQFDIFSSFRSYPRHPRRSDQTAWLGISDSNRRIRARAN
jgi:hypothetical protein